MVAAAAALVVARLDRLLGVLAAVAIHPEVASLEAQHQMELAQGLAVSVRYECLLSLAGRLAHGLAREENYLLQLPLLRRGLLHHGQHLGHWLQTKDLECFLHAGC
jgi:hypothetical protein